MQAPMDYRSTGWVHRRSEQGWNTCYDRSIRSGLGAARVSHNGWIRDSEICVFKNSTTNMNKTVEGVRWGEYGSYGCALWNRSYLNVSCSSENDGVSVVVKCCSRHLLWPYLNWFISSKVDMLSWVIDLNQTPNVYLSCMWVSVAPRMDTKRNVLM